ARLDGALRAHGLCAVAHIAAPAVGDAQSRHWPLSCAARSQRGLVVAVLCRAQPAARADQYHPAVADGPRHHCRPAARRSAGRPLSAPAGSLGGLRDATQCIRMGAELAVQIRQWMENGLAHEVVRAFAAMTLT